MGTLGRVALVGLQPCRGKDAITKMVPHESADMALGAGAAVTEARHVPLDRRGTPRTCYVVADKFGFANCQTVARLRSAIRGKAMRLRQEGLLPPNLPKHFNINSAKLGLLL